MIVRLRPSHTGMMIMMIRRSAVLLMIMVVISAGGRTIRLEIVIFRVGSAHMHTHALNNVTLAAQRPSYFGLNERHETERPERLRYVDVDNLAVFGEVILQVLGGERFREPSHEYLSACLWLLLLYKSIEIYYMAVITCKNASTYIIASTYRLATKFYLYYRT